jgi:preprotein translocase subunit SecG
MTSVLFAAGTFLHYVCGILMFAISVFLILLVLVQRGRGGGLTGALGGMGGQSAFGTKAGDMFTRVTMVTAGIWILLCMVSIWLLGSQDQWGASSKGRSGGGTPGPTNALEREIPGGGPSSESPGTTGAGGNPASSSAGATGAGTGEAKPATGGATTASPKASQPQSAPKTKE